MTENELYILKFDFYSSGVKFGWESACYKIMDYINDCRETGSSDEKVISDLLWFCLTNVSKTPLTSDKI